VESLSALVETNTGELKIIHWPYRASLERQDIRHAIAV
jgi:hypothetical protein